MNDTNIKTETRQVNEPLVDKSLVNDLVRKMDTGGVAQVLVAFAECGILHPLYEVRLEAAEPLAQIPLSQRALDALQKLGETLDLSSEPVAIHYIVEQAVESIVNLREMIIQDGEDVLEALSELRTTLELPDDLPTDRLVQEATAAIVRLRAAGGSGNEEMVLPTTPGAPLRQIVEEAAELIRTLREREVNPFTFANDALVALRKEIGIHECSSIKLTAEWALETISRLRTASQPAQAHFDHRIIEPLRQLGADLGLLGKPFEDVPAAALAEIARLRQQVAAQEQLRMADHKKQEASVNKLVADLKEIAK